MIEGPNLPVALQRQDAAAPDDTAALAGESNLVLAPPRGPRQKHRGQAIGILEQELRAVLDIVLVMPQPPGPGAHPRRWPGDVEKLVDQMGAVVEYHTSAAR